MKRKFIFYACTMLSPFLFTNCSDDNNDNPEKTEEKKLIPSEITVEYAVDGNRQNNVIEKTTFTYNEVNNPTRIVIHTKSPKGKFNPWKLFYGDDENSPYEKIHSINMHYDDNGSPISRTDNVSILIKGIQNDSWTVERIYDYSENGKIRVNKRNEEPAELIYVNGNSLVTQYEGFIRESSDGQIAHFVEKFSYDNNRNVTLYIHDDAENIFQYKYNYDNKPGIYRHVNVPQWFLTTIWARNGIRNNPSHMEGEVDGIYLGWGTYEYNYNSDGYPQSSEYIPAAAWRGTYISNSSVRYQEVNVPNYMK